MKELLGIIKYLIQHPIGRRNKYQTLLRFIKWQVFSKIYPYPIIYTYINDSKLIVNKSLHSATANMYVGLQEFEEMGFALHLLDKNDIFFDIGANIGIYTILASKIKRAKTHAFEPVKATFTYLTSNIALNQIEPIVKVYKIALGDKEGVVNFTDDLDSENHILNEKKENAYSVRIEKLDNIIKEIPLLIKMDVEGYEFHVLNGGKDVLSNKKLKAVIVEMNSSSNRYGINENEIHKFLLEKGFNVYSYCPYERVLNMEATYSNGNNIYIRDINYVKSRITNAKKIIIYGCEI